jgi:hypothetical protein
MTNEERAAGIQEWGRFTPRRAAFLTMALLHGGVCVQRQYDAFAGIANGRSTREFFEKLVDDQLATAYPCAKSKGRIYHLHHRKLYQLIGEPHSRFRKRANVERALERLIVLDAVLATPRVRWLATEREKVEHFVKRHGVALPELPHVTFGTGAAAVTRYFVDKLPIGVGALGELTFMYVLGEASGRAFRSFIEEHRATMKRLPRWRVLLVANSRLKPALTSHRRVVEDLCAAPLPSRIADEFQWYCQMRRAIESDSREPANAAEGARYARARQAFSAPRFYAAYRRWLREGDASLLDLTTSHFHDVGQREGGVMDTLVLSHVYANLIPLARTA